MTDLYSTGYFLFSLDTELAWGHHDCFSPCMFSYDGQREREAVCRILELLAEYEIVATWAFVGHLFFERCEECELCPVLEWRENTSVGEMIYNTDHPLWYGSDLLQRVRANRVPQEIAFHGYTHRLFDEKVCTRGDAAFEIEEWLRLSRRVDFVPRTVIFPRNRVGHLDLFASNGFKCYRGEEITPAMYQLPLIGRAFRRAYYYLSAMTIPPVYRCTISPSGLVNLPSSRWLFGLNRNVDRVLDILHLHLLRMRKITRGVTRAAEEKKILHVWAHPYEFRTENDFEKLRFLFEAVATEVQRGRMTSIGMAALAEKVQHQSTKNTSVEVPETVASMEVRV